MNKFQLDPEMLQIASQIEREIEPGSFEVKGVQKMKIPMRDGILLDASLYVPDQGESWPCILIRHPYPHIHSYHEASCMHFVKHGYAVLIQSCRGTGASEGKWEPFVNEREDGIDTLQWLVQQPFQNGNIALFGQSYSSYTTWIIADAFPPEVKTVFLDLFGVDRYGQMYSNGMFRHDIYTSWAFANSGIKTEAHPGTLYQQALKIRPHQNADYELFGQPLPFYRHYISETSRASEYWQQGIWSLLLQIPQKINIPVFVVEGWFDHHLEGALKGYELLPDEIKKSSRLVIGPWDHIGNSPGELGYPDANLLGTARIKAGLEWFAVHLKHEHSAPSHPVSYYRIGAGKWEHADAWPLAGASRRMYLSADEGSSRFTGRLSSEPSPSGKVQYEYDPQHPLPTHGGSALLAWITPGFGGAPHGSLLQPDHRQRTDVLYFDSPVFQEPRNITGKIQVSLKVSSDAEDTAFSVKLMEVFPDGRSFNIVDGITSLVYRNNSDHPLDYTPGEPVDVKIEMWPTAWQLQKGSFIRVEVASSNFPAYHVHSNFRGPWADQEETKTARQTVYIGESASYIELPGE